MQGNSSATLKLGFMYENGQGVKQDKKTANELYEKAEVQRNVYAQYQIGFMYEYALDIKDNKKIAKEWYRKACDGGHQGSCDNYKKLDEQGY
nr:tetratricopeptide repeat protein [Aliarcobacter cryaerophilus]